jgi:hypothetical protein
MARLSMLFDDIYVTRSELQAGAGRKLANIIAVKLLPGSLASSLPCVGDGRQSGTSGTVPEPARRPFHQPLSMGPPERTMAGMFTVAAAMMQAGVVLSQPVVSTTPSSG